VFLLLLPRVCRCCCFSSSPLPPSVLYHDLHCPQRWRALVPAASLV